MFLICKWIVNLFLMWYSKNLISHIYQNYSQVDQGYRLVQVVQEGQRQLDHWPQLPLKYQGSQEGLEDLEDLEDLGNPG